MIPTAVTRIFYIVRASFTQYLQWKVKKVIISIFTVIFTITILGWRFVPLLIPVFVALVAAIEDEWLAKRQVF